MTTSSSETCEKSSYHSPTPKKGDGDSRQTTSSAVPSAISDRHLGRHRNRQYHALGTELTRNPAGGERRRAGRHPVVDENRGLAVQASCGARRSGTNGTPFELRGVRVARRSRLVRRHPRGTDDFVVQDAYAALADRTHRELGLERHTELADEDHVEGRCELCGNLVRDGNPAARQTEDDDPFTAKVPESSGQATSGVHAVDERHVRSFRTWSVRRRRSLP